MNKKIKYRLKHILAKQDIKYLIVHCSDTEQISTQIFISYTLNLEDG